MKCFFCGKAVSEERYCEGCTTYVCEDCETGRKPIAKGKHDVHRHLKTSSRPK